MKRIITIIMAVALCGNMFAQKQDTLNNAYNENVIVMGSYKPVLEEMNKMNVVPALTDTSTLLQHNFTYGITPQRLTSLFIPSRIKAARVIGEPSTKLYNNYIRLGMGNNWSPLLEAYFNSTRNQKLNYGAYLTHESSWGTIGRKVDSIPYNADYYGPNHWSLTNLGAFAKYIVADKVQVSSCLNYNNDYNLYYGFNDSLAHATGFPTNDSITRSQYRSVYNYIDWTASIRNLQTDVNKLGYVANVEVSDLIGSYSQNEFNLNLSGDIHYGFPLLNTYKGIVYLHADWQAYKNNYINEELPLGVVNLYPSTDTLVNVRNLVRVNPYVDFIFKAFNFHAGFTLGFDGYSSDTTNAITETTPQLFHIYPDVVISKSFMSEDLNISLGATGNLDANSWQTIRLVNPYIYPGYQTFAATSHYDLWAKMRLNFNKKLRLDAHAQYSFLRDDLTFVGDATILHNVFVPYFVDLNQATFGADITFINDEMITAGIGGNYYIYQPSTEALDGDMYRMYRPDYDAHLNVSLNYNNKVYAHLKGVLLGSMYAYDQYFPTVPWSDIQVDENSKLPMRTGLNLEFEYRHNKALSFFARFDNILAQRYFYWMNYPSHRFQFLVGLTYTIH